MLTRISASLIWLIGRIKKMLGFLMAIYATYIPLGFLFMILAIDKEGWVSWGLYMCGAIFLVAGSVAIPKAWGEFRKRDQKREAMFKDLITEIKGLRQDLRR